MADDMIEMGYWMHKSSLPLHQGSLKARFFFLFLTFISVSTAVVLRLCSCICVYNERDATLTR